MWWDPSEITLFDTVLFSILSLVILSFVGFGLLKFFYKRESNPFRYFDIIQKINFNIFLGFAFLFLVALIFSAFHLSFLLISALILVIAAIGILVKRPIIKLPRNVSFKKFASPAVVLVLVLAIIFLSSMLIVGFYGSTNDDGADHTLMTRIILDNPNALISRSSDPYASFYLRYPSETHVVLAFFVSLLGVSIQKIVIMFSVILPALIGLSFYSTIQCMFEKKALSIAGLVLSGFFTIIISWAPVYWAGLPLLLSFYLSISGMGLIYTFLLKNKVTVLNSFLLGLILFIAAQTYPVTLLFLVSWFLLILGAKIFTRFKTADLKRSAFNKGNIIFLAAFLLPLLFCFPYFYFNLSHDLAGVQSNHLTIVSSWVGDVQTKISFNWFIDFFSLSTAFSEFGTLLKLVPFSLMIIPVYFIFKKRNIIIPRQLVSGVILVYIFMLLIFAYLTLALNLQVDFLIAFFDPVRVWQHLFIPGVILTALVIFSAGYLSYFGFKWLIHSKTRISIKSKKVLACCLFVSLAVSAGFLSIPLIKEQQEVYDKVRFAFNDYETLGPNDLALMDWIRDNVPSNSHILVSAGDSGQFVTSVTQRQTVSVYSGFANYSDLVEILTFNASDLRAVPLLTESNVSYVYIGSIPTGYALQLPQYRHFNASQFLEVPYFRLVQRFGDAWLFEVKQTAVNDKFNL
jgi:hypothetical protein